MKIICLDHLNEPLQPILIADSAIRPDGRPLFVPRADVKCEIRVAIRVDRLGKNIAEKFANRYYGEMALVNVMRCADSSANALWTLGDDAVVQGLWQPIKASTMVNINGSEVVATVDNSVVDHLVAEISKATTFKTGDIIIMPEVLYAYTPQADTHLIAISEDNTTLIEFNIK